LLAKPSEKEPARSLASEIVELLNRGAMPPDRDLLPHERRTFIEYIHSLQADPE
jgi:hypothetical protein